jgi:hypothetical protein
MKTIYSIIRFLFTLSVVILLNGRGSVSAQQQLLEKITSLEIGFDFEINQAKFDRLYMSNAVSLGRLDKMLADTLFVSSIDTLTIATTASPDGKYDSNLQLAHNRARQLKLMLLSRYPVLSTITLETNAYVTDWSQLKSLIQEDTELPWRSQVMKILSESKDTGATSWKLKKLGNGAPWRYLAKHYLHYLRTGHSTVSLSLKSDPPPPIDETPLVYVPEKIDEDEFEDILPETPLAPSLPLEFPQEETPELEDEEPEPTTGGAMLALKTNLLFDALSLINVDVEVPLGDRWSIAGEWIFPWWTMDDGTAESKRNRIHLLSGNIEGRYWFGDRTTRPKLTGWFAGAYVAGGLYDFEYKTKGYQGEIFIMGGLSGGYTHTINKKGNLRMEYLLGVGYMQTNYRYYEAHFANTMNEWHPMHTKDGRYKWFGPSRIKVSLVWMLNKKGGRR